MFIVFYNYALNGLFISWPFFLYLSTKSLMYKIMFEIALALATSLLEKIIEKRKKNGKANKAFKKVFTESVNQKLATLYQTHSYMMIELEDELSEEEES